MDTAKPITLIIRTQNNLKIFAYLKQSPKMFAPKFLLILLVCVAFAIGRKHGKTARKMAKNDVAKDELEQAFSPLVPVELAQKEFEHRIDQMEKQLSEVINNVRAECMPKKGEDEEEEEDK